MALTISSLRKDVAGNKRMHSGRITFDNSYPTGGEALAPGDIGLHVIETMQVISAAGYAFDFDYTNNKVLAYTQGATTGATAAGGTTGTLMLTDAGVEGTARLQSAGTSATFKWGPLKEVTNTTDLSTVVARFIAVGY
jgi:hypothetical protein